MTAPAACASARRRLANAGPCIVLVAGLAISETHQLDDMAQGAPLGRRPAGFDVAIIRVGADDQDPQLLIGHVICSFLVQSRSTPRD